ncbi:hypothetical protein SIN8267_00016 [Sinobacterium norvegicum]|uniref:DUF4131 domain-containing protein n=1 Tax=Sinobacterium norvegicum TaxID=1641715 RepID=A0ABM9A9V3_9GAMM|nr:hypothetical protein [Sinobacterium norvegicum]CAH0989944.1 hypothetical protein SIN8267_00016 [Sinobacterium norvegicum]
MFELIFSPTIPTYPIIRSDGVIITQLTLSTIFALCIAVDKDNWHRRMNWLKLFLLAIVPFLFYWLHESNLNSMAKSLEEIVDSGRFETKQGVFNGHTGPNQGRLIIDGEVVGAIRPRSDYRCIRTFDGLYYVNDEDQEVFLKPGMLVRFDYFEPSTKGSNFDTCIFKVWVEKQTKSN